MVLQFEISMMLAIKTVTISVVLQVPRKQGQIKIELMNIKEINQQAKKIQAEVIIKMNQ